MRNQENPQVSVCIPTYNSAAYIKQCLESVLSQSYQNFEILISDNASTDATIEVINSFGDPRIKLHRQDSNLGPHQNFNFLLRQAKSPFIRTFCSDDTMLPTILERQMEAMTAYPNVGVASCHALVKKENGTRTVWRIHQGYYVGDQLLRICLGQFANHVGNPSSFLFRANALEQRIFDPAFQYLSDINLPMEIMRAGWDFFGMDAPGFNYVRHSEADTYRTQDSAASDWLALLDKFGIQDYSAIPKLLKPSPAQEHNESVVLDWLCKRSPDSLKVDDLMAISASMKGAHARQQIQHLMQRHSFREKAWSCCKRMTKSVLKRLS